ncbi:MAG: hypothetical protein M3P04_13060 [Actinomycetota bacterium]|nr:hypothetical protein [Actinomycetota bacterium]
MTAARAVPLRLPETSPTPRALPSTKGLLRLVPQRRSQAAKTPFVVVLVLLLVGGLLGLLLLNTMVAQDSFTLHDLAKQSRDLQLREQQLAGQLEAQQAPNQLAARATEMGMVPGGAPAFLRLPDGRVLGRPSMGKNAITPVAPKPAASSAPSTAARTTAKPAQPRGSTTWTAPRTSPPPTSTGAHR